MFVCLFVYYFPFIYLFLFSKQKGTNKQDPVRGCLDPDDDSGDYVCLRNSTTNRGKKLTDNQLMFTIQL